MTIKTLIFIITLCVTEEIVVKIIFKVLQNKKTELAEKSYPLMRKGVRSLAFIIMLIYINNTVIRKNQNNTIERGKECCFYMHGEIISNKCILGEQEELKLKDLGNTSSEQYRKYCKNNR